MDVERYSGKQRCARADLDAPPDQRGRHPGEAAKVWRPDAVGQAGATGGACFNLRAARRERRQLRHRPGLWLGRRKRTIGTFDSQLLTNASNPFVCASWSIPGSAGVSAFETNGVNIRPAPEQRAKQLDFGNWRRILCDHFVPFA